MAKRKDPITQRDVVLWWVRRVFQYLLGILACFLLVLSLARIFDVNLVNWPVIAKYIAYNFGEILVWLGQKIISILSSIPIVVFDLVTAYLLIGVLIRLAIIDLGMRSEKSFYERDAIYRNDEWMKDGVETAKAATKEEARRYRFLWFIRLASDIKGRYWTLTPLRVLIYLAFVTVLFVLGIYLYGM